MSKKTHRFDWDGTPKKEEPLQESLGGPGGPGVFNRSKKRRQ
ncbi:MAG: hypothetical protein WCD81_10430 [Candidatus Bathyarchaeia archaeon]